MIMQMFIWDCIEERVNMDEKMDYLQVFKFQNIYNPDIPGKRVAKIIHSQEIPEFEDTYFIRDGSSPVEGTIFVIDDGDVVTMLWADEY
jgi:hypothetical protein